MQVEEQSPSVMIQTLWPMFSIGQLLKDPIQAKFAELIWRAIP